jgi:hypothetical protein
MALTKVNYVDGVTTIMAKNLNDIQDEIIANGTAIATQTEQISGKADASALTAEITAREAAVSAEATARAAAINAEATAREASDTALRGEVDDLKSAIRFFNDIPGTVQTVNFDANGNPSSIVHTANGEALRTDGFTWGDNTVTEKRELADGSYITFVTDLTTLVTTISEIQEA